MWLPTQTLSLRRHLVEIRVASCTYRNPKPIGCRLLGVKGPARRWIRGWLPLECGTITNVEIGRLDTDAAAEFRGEQGIEHAGREQCPFNRPSRLPRVHHL